MEGISSITAPVARRAMTATAAWSVVALAALLLAAPGAHAQHGGFHPSVTQQSGRGPRQPQQQPSSQPQPQGPNGGNAMFPTTPSTTGGMHHHLLTGPAGRWWDDKQVAQTVGLRADQKTRMDAIFNANKTNIVDAYQAFLKARERVATLTRQSQPDKAQLFASIDAANEARTALEKATDKMLLQIRAELEPSQLARLEALQ